jgi:DNA-binding transcriptional LysR family regulator
LTLIDCPTQPAIEMLDAGQVDLAIVGQLKKDPPNSFSGDDLVDYPFVLVGPMGHSLDTDKELSLEDFAEQRVVMASPGTNARERVNEILKSAGLLSKLEIALEASTKELLMRYVQMNMGIAIAPMSSDVLLEKNRRLEDRGLFFRDVSNLFGYEHMKILRRDLRQEPEHQRRFREMVLLSSRL